MPRVAFVTGGDAATLPELHRPRATLFPRERACPIAVRPDRRLRAAPVPAGRPRAARCGPLLVGVLAGAVLVGTAAPALAVPPPPPNPTDGQLGAAQSEQDAAAAEVGRIAGLVAAAEAELERVGVQAEAAGTAYLAAEEALAAGAGRAPRRPPPSWRRPPTPWPPPQARIADLLPRQLHERLDR